MGVLSFVTASPGPTGDDAESVIAPAQGLDLAESNVWCDCCSSCRCEVKVVFREYGVGMRL